MRKTIEKVKYFPTTFEAIHLLVLYIFLQSLVDFPLALYDYHHDTNWLGNAWISFASSFTITAFIFIFGFRKAKSSFSKVFAIKGFNPLLIIPILFILPAMQYLIGLLNIQVEKILPAPPWFWELFERVFDSHFGFWGIAFKVVIFAPIIEEVLFRGIIMHGLMRNYRSGYAIFLSGILFSVFHLNPWQMTYTFFLGLLLGWIMIKTRSLPLAIFTHALNNLIVLLTIQFEIEISESALFWLPRAENLKISIMALAIGFLLFIALTLKKEKSKITAKHD
ncbi:MAG TPA: CPBP family intramembrane glutamic endopeptidase [Prolixibacteraceae bacterium]|nr:CPBP family intramembrane glutamic endopeptidase [Prolixibacteraceae bacterium]